MLGDNQFIPLSLNLNVTMGFNVVASQFYVHDLQGNEVCFIHKKPFKVIEEIQIYSDSTKTHLRYNINANQITDYGATYYFSSIRDGGLGCTTQDGIKSLWRTEFEIIDEYGICFLIRLQNPIAMFIAKFIASLLNDIPVIGRSLKMFVGYFISPTYVVTTTDNEEVATMKKLPTLYEIRSSYQLTESYSERVALSLFTIILIQGRIDGGF